MVRGWRWRGSQRASIGQAAEGGALHHACDHAVDQMEDRPEGQADAKLAGVQGGSD